MRVTVEGIILQPHEADLAATLIRQPTPSDIEHGRGRRSSALADALEDAMAAYRRNYVDTSEITWIPPSRPPFRAAPPSRPGTPPDTPS